jgi:hypothetical protein
MKVSITTPLFFNFFSLSFILRPLTAEAWVLLRSVYLSFVVQILATGDRLFSGYFGFSLSVSFHHYSILKFMYMLLLPEGQTGKDWEASKK